MRSQLSRQRPFQKKVFKTTIQKNTSFFFFCKLHSRQVSDRVKKKYVTDEVRNQTSVRDSSGGELESGLTVRPEIRSEGSINVVVVSGIEQRISEHEQSSLVCYQIIIISFAVD